MRIVKYYEFNTLDVMSFILSHISNNNAITISLLEKFVVSDMKKIAFDGLIKYVNIMSALTKMWKNNDITVIKPYYNDMRTFHKNGLTNDFRYNNNGKINKSLINYHKSTIIKLNKQS